MVNAKVDFDRLAADAVAAGIFAADPAAVRANAGILDAYCKFPVTLLDAPYGNGPIAIRVFKQDVPEASVYAVRRNFTEANNLLVPLESVMLYFHQRFISDDVFRSKSLATLVAQYRAARVDPYHDASVDGVLRTHYKPDELSFRIEGVDRTTHDRRLYTRNEHLAALRLVQAHPEIVLAILGDQAVLHDYLTALCAAFGRIAVEPTAPITAKDLADLDGYVNQWRTNNFTDELIPAIAIFYEQRVEAGVPVEERIDWELLHRAVGFIVDSGAFRNWVTIPAETARDGEAHVDHFLCPAVGPIRAQLLDGALLERISAIVRRKQQGNDRLVRRHAAQIAAEAAAKYRMRDHQPMGAEREWFEAPLEIILQDDRTRSRWTPDSRSS